MSVANHYYINRSAQAKTILDRWMTWLDANITTDGGTGWKPPSGYGNDGVPAYTYKPIYNHACIAAACIYKYWVDGDVIALKWYRRLLDDLYANHLQTETGTCIGVSRTTEGTGYTTATVNFSGDGTGAAATAFIAGGKVRYYTVTNAGSGYTTISATISGDGTGATCNPYLSDLIVGAFDKNHTGWEVFEIYNTIGMIVYGSRPVGTVTFPTTLLASDTSAHAGMWAFFQRAKGSTRPAVLTANWTPFHEFDIDPYHNGSGIENPMVRDTNVRGSTWTETIGPAFYAAVETARIYESWTWLDAMYALILEHIGLPGGSSILTPTPRSSTGLSDAYTSILGGESLQAEYRGNYDSKTFVVDASKQIVIPASAGGGDVTWVRGAWGTDVIFRWSGFMAEIDPDFAGTTTNYAGTGATAVNNYAAGVLSTTVQLLSSVSVGATVQLYYSYRTGAVTLPGEAVSGWPSLHIDRFQGTALDGDNYFMMALYHAYNETTTLKYKTAADRIGEAVLAAGQWLGNEMTFSLPLSDEADQFGLYTYNAATTPFISTIDARPDDAGKNCFHVQTKVVEGGPPYNYAGFGAWPSWPIAAATPFTSIDFDLMGDGSDQAALSEMVEGECLLSNLLSASDVDVSGLSGSVRGYRISNVAAIRSAIAPLQGAYPFDVIQSGYTIKFVERGRTSIATIDEDNLDARAAGDTPGVSLTISREMDSVLPQKVAIQYLDAAREYDVGEQSAERLNTDAVNIQSTELAVVLTADEAAQRAEILLYLYWLERYEVSFTLPPTYNHLEPSDVITVTTARGNYEFRLTNISYTANGWLECAAKYNSVATYTSSAVGNTGNSTDRALLPAGLANLVLMDLPCLVDAYNTPGFISAMAGELASWPGGTLLGTTDAFVTSNLINTVAPPGAYIGTATGTLASHTGAMIDKTGSLLGNFAFGEFSTVTQAQMLEGANYFAYGLDGRWEIIAAQTITLSSVGIWAMRDFLRGRFGTEWATGLHAEGDTLIPLGHGAVAFVALNINAIGQSKTYRAVTVGRDTTTASNVVFTYTGVNLKPLSPVYLNGNIHPSTNDWALDWIRRTRVGGNWRDLVDVPIAEEVEHYEIEIYASGAYATVKRTINATTASCAYTSAQQVTDFGGNQTTLHVKIYQMSGIVGRGYPLTATITR